MDLAKAEEEFTKFEPETVQNYLKNRCRNLNSSIDDKLANFFGIDIDLNSQEETSSSIFLNLQNDLINFLLSKGCLIEDVRLLICCYVDILKCTAGKALGEAIRFVQSRLQAEEEKGRISPKALKEIATHLFANYFQNFHLYQFCLVAKRDKMNFMSFLCVEVPPESPYTLADGKSVSVWEYNEKIRQIEEKSKEEHETNVRSHDEAAAQLSEKKRKFEEEVRGLDTHMTKDTVSSIVQQSIALSVHQSKAVMEKLVSDTQTDVTLMIEKTCVPRPQSLGPPTRFKPKSAIKSAKRPPAKTSASGHQSRASRASGRKSKA